MLKYRFFCVFLSVSFSLISIIQKNIFLLNAQKNPRIISVFFLKTTYIKKPFCTIFFWYTVVVVVATNLAKKKSPNNKKHNILCMQWQGYKFSFFVRDAGISIYCSGQRNNLTCYIPSDRTYIQLWPTTAIRLNMVDWILVGGVRRMYNIRSLSENINVRYL